MVNYSNKKYIIMTLADRAVALLLPPALQGAPISATSPIAVLLSRWQLMTLRFMCCRPNPDPFFAGPGSSPLPLAQRTKKLDKKS